MDYVNNGDASSNLAVFMLDGISVEDVMDDFATEPRTTRVTAGYLDTGGGAPADPGETLQWERNLAPGEYVMLCARSRPSFAAWFGSGLTVVEGSDSQLGGPDAARPMVLQTNDPTVASEEPDVSAVELRSLQSVRRGRGEP